MGQTSVRHRLKFGRLCAELADFGRTSPKSVHVARIRPGSGQTSEISNGCGRTSALVIERVEYGTWTLSKSAGFGTDSCQTSVELRFRLESMSSQVEIISNKRFRGVR